MSTDALREILVTVTGPDTPGITAKLARVIADDDATLLDIDQVVVKGQLTLCLLLGVDPEPSSSESVLKNLLFLATRLGLDLKFQVLELQGAKPPASDDTLRYAVTAIGDGLGARGLALLADVLFEHGANIETIRPLSSEKLTSLEFIIALPGGAQGGQALRAALVKAAHEKKDLDVAVQRETLTRRSKRLVVMDMDSTLIRIEVIDELARMHGVVDQVSAITHRAMAGELDFDSALRERVALLKGLSYEKAMGLARDLPLTEGATDLLRVLRHLGYKTGVLSGGFTFAALALRDRLGLDYAYANTLEIRDGVLTGRILDPIVGPQRKADLLDAIAQREGISLEQTIAVGDGANDLPMLERAGLGIAFHAKPKLRAAADTSLSAGGLDRLLYLLGMHARDVRELLLKLHDSEV